MYLETSDGVIELKGDGTYIKHPVRYHVINGRRVKEDIATGAITPVNDHILLTVNETGDIETIQKGFILDYEFKNPIHPDAKKKYIKLNTSDLPEGFTPKAYKIGKNGKLRKR